MWKYVDETDNINMLQLTGGGVQHMIMSNVVGYRGTQINLEVCCVTLQHLEIVILQLDDARDDVSKIRRKCVVGKFRNVS